MANNITILTENGRSINSEDYWGFGISVKEHENIDDEYVPDEIQLLACQTHKKGNFLILTLYDERSKVCDALLSLLQAIERGDDVWDAKKYTADK